EAGQLSTLAILVDDGVEEAPWVVETLVDELARRVPVVRLTVRGGQDALPLPRLIATIDEQEERGGLTILDVDLGSGPAAQRGLAHAGASRALGDAGVPLDRVGGSSSGGVIAAQIAAGWSPDELLARNRAEWPRAHPNRRFTLPLLSLLSPESAIRMLDRMFG